MPRLLSFVCLLLLGSLYAYRLHHIGMTNWDAVSNYERVQQLSMGNFEVLFHHGSPTFFLIFTPIAYLFKGFLVLEYTNLILMLVAVWVWVRLFALHFQFSELEKALCLLWVGSSLLLIDTARSFSIEALSLLLWGGAMTYFVAFLQDNETKSWNKTWLFLALLFTVNYKIVLLFPVFFVGFFLKKYGLKSVWRVLKPVTGVSQTSVSEFFLSPFFALTGILVAYILMGWCLGLPLITYPKTIASLFFRGGVRGGIFHTDVDYYLYYLSFFENPLLLPTLIACIFLYRKKVPSSSSFMYLMVGTAMVTLVLMSVLAKAPRGLLFILPIMYGLAFELFRQSKQYLRWVFLPIIVVLLSYQLWQAQTHIFFYTHTHYEKLFNHLKINRIDKIILTNGKGLIPLLDNTLTTKIVANERDVAQAKQQGFRYALIDDYCRIAQLDSFPMLRQQKPLWQSTEPTLEAPLIYLDHSEFTGMTFNETLQLRKSLQQDSIRLRLVRF